MEGPAAKGASARRISYRPYPVPNSIQHDARVSQKHHAKILGGAYRQPQFYLLKIAMRTRAISKGHSPVIISASLKTTITERLEAPYVDVEDISGKSCPLVYRSNTFQIYRFVYVLGADDMLLSSRESRQLRVILPGGDKSPHSSQTRPVSRATAW